MPNAPDSDERFKGLLAAAKKGDEQAVQELLSAAEPRLRACVDQRLGPQLRGRLRHSDVLQNSYLEMLRALDGFEGDSIDTFIAWVAQIIEHDIRRQNRWFNAAKRSPPERTSERNHLARVLLDAPTTPSGEAVAGEDRALLRRALERLPLDYAQVIQFAVFEELSHAEIAVRMERSERACRMLLLRARTALAFAIEQEEGRN